jgi:signal transduction histidine kinase
MTADTARKRRHRLTASVRFRVTALAALATLAVLVVVGVAVVAVQVRTLTDNLEESIEQGADNIERALERGEVPTALGGFGDDDTVAQVVDERGRVVASTANAEGNPPIAAAPPEGRRQVRRTIDGLLDGDVSFLSVSRRIEGPDGGMVVHVAATLEDIEESGRVLAASLAVATPAVVALLAALVWWLTGRTLRPVEAIRAEVADISGSDLHLRVTEPATGDEIDRLAATMNAMLDRVERASAQQQRFVADASHELRAPLTRMRSELEVDLAHPEQAEPAATLRSVLDEAIAMQRLVEDLMHLARGDAGAVTSRRDPVDLDAIVVRHASALRATGRVEVDTSAVRAAQVTGDASQLGRAIENLLDNAARHARSHVHIAVSADGDAGGCATVAVSDDGPGIPSDQREAIFDRFTRLDEARSAGAGGVGLGLAIARDIVERHGGTVRVDPDHAPGARIVITLPARDGRSTVA